GAIQATDGTNSSPAYSFLDTVNTGIYRHSTTGVGVSCGGVATAHFQSGSHALTLRPSSNREGLVIFPYDDSQVRAAISIRDDAANHIAQWDTDGQIKATGVSIN